MREPLHRFLTMGFVGADAGSHRSLLIRQSLNFHLQGFARKAVATFTYHRQLRGLWCFQ